MYIRCIFVEKFGKMGYFVVIVFCYKWGDISG